jgi:hypothetical protein
MLGNRSSGFSPHAWDGTAGTIEGMDYKKILAANFVTLMAQRGYRRGKDVVEGSSGRLTNGTVGRLRQGGTDLTLRTLAMVADHFNVSLCELLAPDMRRPEPMSDAARRLAELFDALPDGLAKQKAYAISQLELMPTDDMPPEWAGAAAREAAARAPSEASAQPAAPAEPMTSPSPRQ